MVIMNIKYLEIDTHSPFASPIFKSLGGRGVRGGVIDSLSDHHYPLFFLDML